MNIARKASKNLVCLQNLAAFVDLFQAFLNFKSFLFNTYTHLQNVMPVEPKMKELWQIFKNKENGPREVPRACGTPIPKKTLLLC